MKTFNQLFLNSESVKEKIKKIYFKNYSFLRRSSTISASTKDNYATQCILSPLLLYLIGPVSGSVHETCWNFSKSQKLTVRSSEAEANRNS